MNRRGKRSRDATLTKQEDEVPKPSKLLCSGSGTPRISNCSATKTTLNNYDVQASTAADQHACSIQIRPKKLPPSYPAKTAEKKSSVDSARAQKSCRSSVVKFPDERECWEDLPVLIESNDKTCTSNNNLLQGVSQIRSKSGNGCHVLDVEYSSTSQIGVNKTIDFRTASLPNFKEALKADPISKRRRKRKSEGQSEPVRRSRRKSVEPDRFVSSTDDSATSETQQPKSTSKQPQRSEEVPSTVRRSRRKSSPPNRLIDCAGANEESPSRSILDAEIKPNRSNGKKKRKGSDVSFCVDTDKKSQNEKLPFKKDNKSENESVSNDEDAAFSNGEWTEDEVARLRNAHKKVNPRSSSFWHEIADFVNSRTSSECRDKWFSLVKTPLPPRAKRKAAKAPPAHDIALSTQEDDIFNSTPMRGMFSLDCESNDLSSSIGNLDFLSFGSAIKVANNPEEDDIFAQLPKKAGNKTYLKGMKREINKETRQKVKSRKKKVTTFDPSKKLSEKATEGVVEMKCQLSPGGTLNVKTVAGASDDEEDDYFMYGEDEDVEE